MTFKPVGIDEDSLFPDRVEQRLAQQMVDTVQSTAPSIAAGAADSAVRVAAIDWRRVWAKRAFDPPVASKRPTLTIAGTNASNIASPVTATPSKVGTGSQTTNWDGADDPTFRYGGGAGPATLFQTDNGAPKDLALYGMTKPGGAAQAATWPVIYEFATASPVVEIACYHKIGDTFMVEVDGSLVSDSEYNPATFAAGWSTITLTFPTPGHNGIARRIRVFASGAHGLNTVRVASGYTITKPAARPRRVAIIGDSWANGLNSFMVRLARLIDPEADYVLAAIGGTGYNSGTSEGVSNRYATRLSQVLATNPDVLMLYGSQNDGNVNIRTHVEGVLATSAAVPKIVGVSTLLQGYGTQVDSVRSAFATYGRTFIDVRGLIHGSGALDNKQLLSGNTSLFLRSAGDLHITDDGNRTVAEAIFCAIPDTVTA